MTSVTSKRYSKTTYMILCGLFAAITAVCSFITIPLGFTPVPINLGTLAVFLTGGILGKKYGTISMTVYVLLGAAGVPVFAGFRAGISVLAGPTGGYIIGYIVAVFIIGVLADVLVKRSTAGEQTASGGRAVKETLLYALAMVIGLLICYAFGTAWFMFVYTSQTGAVGLMTVLGWCVFPFIIPDIIKIVVATILADRLHKFIK